MKTRFILTTVLIGLVYFTAFSQEIDDMYFNSKDRAKINANTINSDIGLAKNTTAKVDQVDTGINPTDSYSARNINPEYSSQVDATTANSANDNYFIADYQPTGVNKNLSNCNCSNGSYYSPYSANSAFNNPYYGNMGGFGSPYGSYYPSYYGNMYSPFGGYGGFRPGLSMSMGYGMGGYSPGFYSGMGYGMGGYGLGGYGMGMYGGNFFNPYGSPWGYNYYPQVVVVNGDNGGRQIVYQKRASRSSTLNNNINNNYVRPVSGGTALSNVSRSTAAGGRSRSSQPEYYNRGWKRDQSINPTRGYWNNGTSSSGNTGYGSGNVGGRSSGYSSQPARGNWNNNGNTRSDFNWGNSGGRSSGFSQPTRSFNSGGSRMGGSFGGSSGGSHTRGRNN